jgi:diketogulonate reductase-like aldo/keto reductase
MLDENYTLANGYKIPKIGLGTWQMTDEEAYAATLSAIKSGYRQIDTASVYGNEGAVGKAVKDSKADREKLFITTKIRAEYKSVESAEKCIKNSFELLKTDYIDLLLIHAPMPWDEICGRAPKPPHRYEKENLQVWHLMEEYVKAGKVRSIGLSNFENEDILNILGGCTIKPVVNQVRCYIGNTPRNGIDFCKEHSILVQAYSPNATGRLLNNEVVKKVAAKYNVTIPQLAVKYDLQLGTQPLPKTTNPAHQAEYAELDFTISAEDMASLESLGVVSKVREK